MKPVKRVLLIEGSFVAIVLTVYGIETLELQVHNYVLGLVATVLTVYGIETQRLSLDRRIDL